MLTVADMLLRIRASTHDKQETGYKDKDILYAINGGIRFIRRLIKDYKPLLLADPPYTGTLKTGESFVKLDAVITKVIDIRIQGQTIPVTDLSNIADMTKAGTPYAYYMTGFSTINFYPAPDKDVNYSIIAIGDLKEVDLQGVSPFPNDFDDFLVEYAVIRLSVGNEFDVSQEQQIMSSIIQQIQNNLMGDGQPINQVSGYFSPLPPDWNSIRGGY